MITESLLNIFFGCISGFLRMLPDFSWDVNPEVFDSFFSFIRMAGYLLPMRTVFIIINIIFLLNLLKIIIAVVKTVWALLPFT